MPPQRTTTPLDHAWEHTVGSGHATLALRADWQAQLHRCHDELGFRHVRFNGLFCDDMGTCVEQGGEAIYSFFNCDRIFDFLLSIGMRPFIELGFMPEALASGHKTVFHYRANITAPKDAPKWAEFVARSFSTASTGTASMKSGSGSSKSGTSRICRISG